MTTEIQTVETLRADVAPVVQNARSLTIATAQDYKSAADHLMVVKGLWKKADDLFVAPWRKAKQDAESNRKRFHEMLCAPLEQAETILKDKQLAWSANQERIRREEQARLQAAADEAARRERERLEREAAKLKTPELKAARLEQAAAVAAPVVTVASVTPEIKGQSVRKTWVAVVVDAAKVPAMFLMVNEPALQAFARSTKGAVPVAGVRFEEQSSLASSAK